MTDAEATVKHAIFGGIIDHWHTKDAKAMQDEVFKRIFDPTMVWALKEHLQEIEKQTKSGQ